MTQFKTLLKLYIAEFLGTAFFVALGMSLIILIWGAGSSVPGLVSSIPLRQAMTGFLVGCISCLIALSPVGKMSGAHINPAVSFAFWLNGKMKTYALLGYVFSQMLGALLGALPLLLWGKRGLSVGYGNTTPGRLGLTAAFFGEIAATGLLVFLILIFTGSKRWRGLTPFISPPFYGLMVWIEGSLSGCSTNPARSFGPAVISGTCGIFWIYMIAPLAAAALVAFAFEKLRLKRQFPIEAARTCYHDSYSPECLRSS